MSDETQYNNVMNIISKYPNMPAKALNEKELREENIMSAVFSNTFIPSDMKNTLLKYLHTDIYSNMESNIKYFDIDMNLISGSPTKNNKIVDMDVSYYNKPEIVKYYFLLDTISEIYAFMLKNDPTNFVTVRSRYILKDGVMTLRENGNFSFAINYKYTEIEGITYFKISNVTNGVSENVVSEMCNLFMKDILKHLNYINKTDTSTRNETYLTSLIAFYKFCRLRLVYYTITSAIAVSENIDKSISNNLSYTFLNLKNYIILNNNNDSKSIILRHRLLSTRKKVDESNFRLRVNEQKIKRNQKLSNILKDNYLSQILYAIFVIAIVFMIIIFIMKTVDADKKSGDFLTILIILFAILIYVSTYYLVQFNSIDHIENFSVITKFPATAATSDFYKETTENVKIRIKPSSELSVKTAGWKVFDNNTDTYWESNFDTFEKPKRKFTKTVCTTVATSSDRQFVISPPSTVCGQKDLQGKCSYYTTVYNPGDRKIGSVSFNSSRTSCSSVIISKDLNESAPQNLSSSYTDTDSSSIHYDLKNPLRQSKTTTSSTTNYSEVPGQDLTHSFAKGGTKNAAQYLIFDLGVPVVLTHYKIKFVDRDTAPKTYRLIATNDSKLLDIDEVFGTWHTTIDDVDVDPNSTEFGALSLMRTGLNKSQEPVIDNSGQLAKSVGNYKILEFTENSYVDILDDMEIDILLVGGGGSGGTRNGGGGGAGACIYETKKQISKGRYIVVIGEGGASIPAGPGKPGNNGGDTMLVNENTNEAFMIAKGGGGGGGGIDGNGVVGLSGASSGGSTKAFIASDESTKISTVVEDSNLPTGKYGNEGGYGNYGYTNVGRVPGAGGGGGGAGNVGKTSTVFGSENAVIKAGDGGDGVEYDISGEKRWYGGGGGGGTTDIEVRSMTIGTGGKGGGGDGIGQNMAHSINDNKTYIFMSSSLGISVPNGFNKRDYVFKVGTILHRYEVYITQDRSFSQYINSGQYDYRSGAYYKRHGFYSTNRLTGSYNHGGKTLEYIGYNTIEKVEGNTIYFKNSGTNINDTNISNEWYTINGYVSGKSYGGTTGKAMPNSEANRAVNVGVTLSNFYSVDILPQDAVQNTGSGGGGGGTKRGIEIEDKNTAEYISGSGAGGSGVAVIRYKKPLNNEFIRAFDEYRYYALVVDKLTGLGTSVKISELEFYKIPKTSSVNTSAEFYSELLSPEIEIVGEAKAALDAANKAYDDQKKLEIDNAKKIQDLKDQLANLGEDDLDWTEIENNNKNVEDLLELISEYEAKITQEATKKAAHEVHLAAQKLVSAQINLEEAQLQTHINTLKDVRLRIEELQKQIGDSENTKLLEDQEKELITITASNLTAKADLEQAKIKEQSDKLLLLREQQINKDFADQLATLKVQLVDSQTELENAVFIKNNITNKMNILSQSEIDLVDARIAKAQAEVRKMSQISITDEAKLRAELQTAIENERKQHLAERQMDFAILTNQSEANQANILLLQNQISEINGNLLNVNEYTSNYLDNSSQEYSNLELEKLQLNLDILQIQASIDDFISNIGENARKTNEDRMQSVDIQKELDNQVQENIGWKQMKRNYKFASENALSVEKSIYDVETKISMNMESAMTTIANSIVTIAYENELVDVSERKENSNLLSAKSEDDVNEQMHNNKINRATIKLVLNLFILSVVLVILNSKYSIIKMMTFIIIVYVILIVLYIIEIVTIVRTRTDQKYWKRPDLAKLK